MSRNLWVKAWLVAAALALPACGDDSATKGGGAGPAGTPAAAPGAPAAKSSRAPAARVTVPVADDLARLVPAEAFGVVYIPSIDGLVTKLRSVVASVDADAAQKLNATDALADIAGPAAPHVDHTRAAAIVLSPGPDRDAPPSPTFLLPVKDGAAAKAAVGDVPPGRPGPVVVGSYLAVSQAPNYQAPATPSSLLRDVPAGDVTLRLDLARLIGAYRAQIDEAMGQVGSAGAGGGPAAETPGLAGAQEMLKGLTEFAKKFLDSAERLDLSLRLDGGATRFDLRFTAKPGSPMDRPAATRGDLSALAACLPQDYPIVVLLGGGMKEMMEWATSMSELSFAALPEKQRTAMKGLMGRSKEMTALLGDGMAVGARIGESGMEIVEVFAAKDAKAYLAKMDEMIRGAVETYKDMGMTFTVLPAATVSGAEVHGWAMKFDWEKLMAATGQNAGQDPRAADMARKAMESMFGPDGMRMRTAAVGDRVVVVGGGSEDLMAKAVAAAKSPGKPPPAVASALAAAGDRPSFVLALELRALVGGVLTTFGKSMGEASGKPAPQLPAGGPVPVTAFGGADGREYWGTLTVDVGAAAGLVKGIMEQMGAGGGHVPPDGEDMPGGK